MNENETDTGKRVFVTGGSGLVGAHLVTKLVSKGYDVTALYRSVVPAIENADKLNWIKGDILDIIFLEEAMSQADQVYHCAAMVSYNPRDKHAMMQANVEGTINIVNAALNTGIKKVCYVSSVATLGRQSSSELLNENEAYGTPKLESNYAKSKYLAEAEVWRAIGEGLNCVIVNPSIILGAGDWNKSSAKLFKTAYDAFPWYAEGATGFTDVQDVVKAMIMLMESDVSGERFIVNTDNRTFREIFSAMAKGFQKQPPHKKVTPFLAGLLWRLEALKSSLTGSEPLITKETADNALTEVKYDNEKLLKLFPAFNYTPIDKTIERVCGELKQHYNL